MATLFEELAAPFNPRVVSWRVGPTRDGKGLALAFIDARDVMGRLDEVCGPDGWQNRYSHVGGITVCEIGVRVDGEWLWKADGAGASDMEAEKGALSDAFKRAAVRWGIGRYLYEIPSPWVQMDGRQIAKDAYADLEKLLQAHTTEFEWGSAESRATLRLLLRTVQTFSTEEDVTKFRKENAGTIAQLRVKAREKLDEELDRIAEHSQAVAA